MFGGREAGGHSCCEGGGRIPSQDGAVDGGSVAAVLGHATERFQEQILGGVEFTNAVKQLRRGNRMRNRLRGPQIGNRLYQGHFLH